MSNRKVDELVESLAKDIMLLPALRQRLAEKAKSPCIGCSAATIGHLRKQIAAIGDRLESQSSRIKRIANKHAANLTAALEAKAAQSKPKATVRPRTTSRPNTTRSR